MLKQEIIILKATAPVTMVLTLQHLKLAAVLYYQHRAKPQRTHSITYFLHEPSLTIRDLV